MVGVPSQHNMSGPSYLGLCPHNDRHVLKRPALRGEDRQCDSCELWEPAISIGASCAICDLDYCTTCVATMGADRPRTRAPRTPTAERRRTRFDVPEHAGDRGDRGESAEEPADGSDDDTPEKKKRKREGKGNRSHRFISRDLPFDDPGAPPPPGQGQAETAAEKKERYDRLPSTPGSSRSASRSTSSSTP